MSKISPQSRAFLDRVKAGAAASVDISGLSNWMVTNTSHPKDSTKPWSFKYHEMQVDIVNDDAGEVSVRKCSQVGLSEIVVRLALGLVSILRNSTAIYTLPTSGFASSFAKSRVDPVIEGSEILREALDPDNDNVKLKRLGDSFLYILGTYTQKAAISIPADILISDEVDFSNPQALTTFASRLGHADDGGIRRKFSTPTVSGYGISEEFELSSQKYYGVVCDHCHDTVFPAFFEDVVIPGYEDDIEEFDKDDLLDPRFLINDAFLKCPECSCQLSPQNLIDPEKRRWVAKYPEREASGYQVSPFDVPTINPVWKTLKAIKDYDRYADWVNFKVGLPFEDAESSFLKDILKNHRTAQPKIPPGDDVEDVISKYAPSEGLVMGVDVGKLSWVVIGRPLDRKRIQVIWAERIRQGGEGQLLKRLCFLVKWFKVSKAVIDAGPDFTTSMGFVSAFPMGRTFANYYVSSKSRSTLSHISVNGEEGILSTVRTDSFDLLVKKVNAGLVELPKISESDLIIDHLSALKRVEVINNQGEKVANWTSIGADHYGHALNYLNIAATLLDDRFLQPGVHGVLPMAVVTRLKTPA